MIKNQAGQVVTANLVALADGTSITSGTVSVQVLGDGGTKTAGAGTIENEGGGTWSYFPTQAETNYAAVTYSFVHSDALRVDVQFNPIASDCPAPPVPSVVSGGYWGSGYYGGGSSSLAIDGEIASPIVIGDDYTVASGRSFVVDVAMPPGAVVGDVFRFVGRHRYRCDQTWSTSGVISEPVSGTARMSAELPAADNASLVAGEYVYTLSIVRADGTVVTPVASLEVPVTLVYGPAGPPECC